MARSINRPISKSNHLQIQVTLAALHSVGLARERLIKLDFRQKEIEDRIYIIQQSLELQEDFISQPSSSPPLEEARKRYLALVREQKELSEKMGMLLFEREVLQERFYLILLGSLLISFYNYPSKTLNVEQKFSRKKLLKIFIIKNLLVNGYLI